MDPKLGITLAVSRITLFLSDVRTAVSKTETCFALVMRYEVFLPVPSLKARRVDIT